MVRLAKAGWKNTAVAAVASGSISVFAQTQKYSGPVQFASTVELTALHVTVTDQSRQCLTGSPPYWTNGWDGCPVTDLPQKAFQISENGVPQTITVFNSGDVPISISLVIDVRLSGVRMRDVHDAALRVVQKLRAQDLAAVIGFENAVEFNQPPTANRPDLERAIRRTSLHSSAAPPSLLATVLRDGSLTRPPQNTIRRHAIVVLTDARTSLDPAVLPLARRSDASVYVIGFTGDEPLEESREPAVSLRRLAGLTGGRAFFPTDSRRLSSAYSQIFEELSRQYTIGYASTHASRDGRWRDVTVHVNRADTSARTRQGYYAAEK